MFILNKKWLNEFDLRKARQFVDYWREHYRYEIKVYNSSEIIDYLKELNLGNRLTEQNVKRLLRWKDPRMLTEEILSGPNQGKNNQRVMRVIEKLDKVNDFRFGRMNEYEFLKETNNIFPNGIIWQIFLFHIARPFGYPIADQNVFRTYCKQNPIEIQEDWDGYMHYVDYFFQISISAGIITGKPNGDEHNIEKIVSELKTVDDALFAFGQFLNLYG